MNRKIHLYIPYYLSEDFDRQKEINICLSKNVSVDALEKIFVLVDDGSRPDIISDKIEIIDISGRPTYADWVDLTSVNSNYAISVLANSDIYVDNTIELLGKVFASSTHAFAAISRYEIAGETVTLHKNPHWSQDVWAIDGKVPVSPELRKNINIPLGVPRCDNKIGYVFSVHGYDIFNPCHFVRTYHLHETQVRSYDSHVDKRILGGTAWIYASEAIDKKSKMVFDVWTLKPEMVERIKVNDTIIVKEKQGLGAPKKKISSAIVAYDRNWQFPAITEQHAFERLAEDLNLGQDDGSVIYLAFPWATLLDNLLHNKKNPEKTAFLKKKLMSLKPRLEGARSVVTTCQHIHMLRFQSLFQEMGVTDIFWSHAVKGQTSLPEFPGIAVHPFPLYPVQAVDVWNAPPKKKKHLYSFVGAKANQYYLTQSRNIIIDELPKTKTGFIAGNDTWHYNKVVYDHQVRGLVDKPDTLVDNSASERFRLVLQESVFSLCPSGTGPNSIRLWESIGVGSIPVILADNLSLPGDPALWDEAVVFCKEDKASIMELPALLKKMHGNPGLLARKRHAMSQIWELYGVENFVYDIRNLMLEKSQHYRLNPAPAAPRKSAPKNESFTYSADLGSLTTELILTPNQVAPRLKTERAEIKAMISKASAEQKDVFYRALKLRNLKHIWDEA